MNAEGAAPGLARPNVWPLDAVHALAILARFSGVDLTALFEAAEAAARTAGDAARLAQVNEDLGHIALERSDHEEARRRYEVVLPMYRQVGSVLGEANCIRGLGNIALAGSDHEEARRRYEEALGLYGSIGEPYSIGMMHRRLARLSADNQRTRHLEAARAAWAGIGRPDLVAELDAEFASVGGP